MWPLLRHPFGVSLIICVFGACNGGGSDTLPAAPSAPIVPPPALPPITTGEDSKWVGDATNLSCSGDASLCSSYTVGRTASDQRWSIRRSDTEIGLYSDADMSYRGTVDGRRFVATYVSVGFNTHATLEGEFAENGHSFEAVDTFVIGSSDIFQVVTRHRAVRIR